MNKRASSSSTFAKFPPGPSSPPLLQLLRWIKCPDKLLEDSLQRYGETFTLNIAKLDKVVVFSNPQAIREIFSAKKNELHSPQMNKVLRRLVGENSLLFLEENRHSRERRMLSPSFHGERMRFYGATIRETTENFTESWSENKAVTMHSTMQAISLEIIVKAVFGVRNPKRLQLGKGLLLDLMKSFGGVSFFFTMFLPFLQNYLGSFSIWKKQKEILDKVDEFIYEEIASRREEEEGEDILSILVSARDEDGNPPTDAQLRDQLLTLLIAGHETTATSSTWALYWIHRTEGVLTKLKKELSALSSLEEVMQNKYFDAVCKEVLRLASIAPAIPRLVQKDMTIDGQKISAGTTIMAGLYLTHRREDLYPEPHKFIPERFLEKKYSSYEFFPFGGGVRRCIGEAFALYEMKIILATILQKFELELTEKKPVGFARRAILLAPSSGIHMLVKKRLS